MTLTTIPVLDVRGTAEPARLRLVDRAVGRLLERELAGLRRDVDRGGGATVRGGDQPTGPAAVNH